jgi:hypothetical protein
MQAMGVEGAAQQVLPNPLAYLSGMPGTRSSLALRVVQFVGAMLAAVAMLSADDFSDASAFRLVCTRHTPPFILFFLFSQYES